MYVYNSKNQGKEAVNWQGEGDTWEQFGEGN